MDTFNRVKQTNLRWGKKPEAVGSDEYWLALSQQLDRVEEELREAREAVANRDLANAPKEGCDLDVVVSGFNVLGGHDYERAIEIVCDENDLKYTSSFYEAEDAARELGDVQRNQRFKVVKYYDPLVNKVFFSVHRVSDDKVCKLIGHPSHEEMDDKMTKCVRN